MKITKPMKITNKLFTGLALVAVLVATSCSSNDNDALEGEPLSEKVMQDFVKDIQALSVPAALSASNNQYAQQANAQFETLKLLGSSFATLFTVPANATSVPSGAKSASKESILNTQTYTWSADGVSVTYVISETSKRYNFEYSIVSPDFTGKFMDGYQLKDGSYAEASLYIDNVAYTTIKWWVETDTTKIELDTDGYKLVLESNSNNSGNMKVYEGTFLASLYEWTASGSGSYTDYNTNMTYSW